MTQAPYSIPNIPGKQRILVAPLNWGLGHATRCIPIIEKLISDGHDVIIAADGYPLALLQEAFPRVKTISFPSFSIHYSKARFQIGHLLLRLPKILLGIWKEHRKLQIYIGQYRINYVISDNRFGLWSRLIPSVYITHQLMIKMPKSLRLFEPLAWAIHRVIISRYSECWIPDKPDKNSLSGDLAHKYPLPKNARFIGHLSRFSGAPTIIPTETYHTVVLVSGPEPQRSLFEKEWTLKLHDRKAAVLIVQGLPQQEILKKQIDTICFVSHLPTAILKAQLLAAKKIICRSGYSSIMDMHTINKKAAYYPTPGQTEQEYLATLHNGK